MHLSYSSTPLVKKQLPLFLHALGWFVQSPGEIIIKTKSVLTANDNKFLKQRLTEHEKLLMNKYHILGHGQVLWPEERGEALCGSIVSLLLLLLLPLPSPRRLERVVGIVDF